VSPPNAVCYLHSRLQLTDRRWFCRSRSKSIVGRRWRPRLCGVPLLLSNRLMISSPAVALCSPKAGNSSRSWNMRTRCGCRAGIRGAKVLSSAVRKGLRLARPCIRATKRPHNTQSFQSACPRMENSLGGRYAARQMKCWDGEPRRVNLAPE